MLDILRQTSCTSGPSKSNSSWKGIVSTLLLIVKGSISIPIAIIYTDRASTRATILVFRGTLRMLELRIPDARAMQTQDDRLSARSELRLRDAPQNSSSRCEPTTGTGTSASLSFSWPLAAVCVRLNNSEPVSENRPRRWVPRQRKSPLRKADTSRFLRYIFF